MIQSHNFGVYKILSYISKKRHISQILDPMTTIFRLALLKFKTCGTKISIDSNRIISQEPGMLQSITRYYNGDQRTDLHKLNNPIKKALEWYSSSEDGNYSFIFEIACKGMEKLQNQYDVGLVKVSLDHYITLIENTLESQKLNDKIIAENDENVLYTEFKALWSFREIQIICDLMRVVNELDEENIQRYYYIEAIESILKGKDECVSFIINKMNSG